MPERSEKSNAFSVTWLIVLHLAIVVPLAYLLNIWADEASTLYTTQHGFLAAFQHAATDEKQAPLYFWILSLWRSVNDSIFFARLFSVICSAAAIKLFAGLARRLFEPRAALFVTAFFAFHPFLIWASLEIRVYSFVILLSVLLITLFQRGFLDEFHAGEQRLQRKEQIIFLLTAIVALYTNYYLGFLLAGLFASLLVTLKWRMARDYAVVMVIASVAFLPQIVTIKSQFLANTSGFHEARSLIDGLRNLWHHFVIFMLPTGIFPEGDGLLIAVIRLWIVRLALALIAWLAIRNRGKLSSRTVASGIVAAVVFAALLSAYFLLGPDFVAIRHSSVLFVPLILFTASLLSDLFDQDTGDLPGVGRYFVPVAGMFVLLSFSYSLATLYPNLTKRGDWARVGQFIQQNESPGQPIIVFTTYDALALPYYYSGVNKILPDQKFFEFDQEAAFGTENSLKGQTDFVVSEIPADADEIWLTVNEQCLITEACVPLENFILANYTIEKEQEFYLEKVFLLRKKTQ